jgi:hypothetical protein
MLSQVSIEPNKVLQHSHGLLARITEPAEQEDAFPVHDHPVPRARCWAALAGQLLPPVCLQIQSPHVLVVLELLLCIAAISEHDEHVKTPKLCPLNIQCLDQ